MKTATAGSGMKWVGRAIRRLEDPALVTGRGRFTADLAAAHQVRFVRSPVASGRIVAHHRAGRRKDRYRRRSRRRAADPADAAQIRLSADRAADCWRRTSCGLSASRSPPSSRRAPPKPRTSPIASRSRSRNCRRWSTRATRSHPMRRACTTAGNVVVEGRIKTADFETTIGQSAPPHPAQRAFAPPERDAARSARRARGVRPGDRAASTLTCTTQMPHLTRTAIADILGFAESDLRVIAPDVGGGFGQKMSLPPNMSCWSGWRGSSARASPGARTGAKI